MHHRKVLAIACEVFAIWFLCQLFLQLGAIFPMMNAFNVYTEITSSTWAVVVIAASFLVAGLIIGFILIRLASRILRQDEGDVEVSISTETQKYVFQVFGLFLVVNCLVFLPSSITYIYVDDAFSSSRIPELSSLFGRLVQGVVGLALVVNSSWWVLLFKNLRGRT